MNKRFSLERFAGTEECKTGKIFVLDAPCPFAFQLADWNPRKDGAIIGDNGNNVEYKSSCAYTQKQFKEMFPDEDFFLSVDNEDKTNEEPLNIKECSRMLDGFDLIGSCERQSSFLWQVSRNCFQDDVFLREGVENYTKFVRLVATLSSQQYLVPTYQIDLMWHTHILTSIRGYHDDITRVSKGKTLNHDDSINDRSEGGELDTNFKATCRLWKETYGSEYIVPGGMYRGEPPLEYFKSTWVKDNVTKMKNYNRHSWDPFSAIHSLGWDKEQDDEFSTTSERTEAPESTVINKQWQRNNDIGAFIEAKGERVYPPKEGYVFGHVGMIDSGELIPNERLSHLTVHYSLCM